MRGRYIDCVGDIYTVSANPRMTEDLIDIVFSFSSRDTYKGVDYTGITIPGVYFQGFKNAMIQLPKCTCNCHE